MSRGVVPFSSSPSFAFSAIVAVSCFPGMLQRDGKEQGRGRRGDEGEVEGAVNISPATAVFPPFFSPSLVF